jgi:outer membrane protein, heavy metal efflux system
MEIQLNQVTVLRRQADAAFRGAWNQLMAVTGLGQMAPGTLDGELPETIEITDMQPIKQLALSASPELQAARSRVARARANIERQEVQAIPNLQFLLAGGVDNGTNSQMLNAQVGLPVPLFNKNQGNIMAAHAEMTRACQDLRRIELAIESRMARAAQEYESAAAAVEQYRQMILPKAAETLKLTEDAYEAGEFGFLQILVARRTYFDANLEYVIAQSELAKAKAYLDGLALSGGLDSTRDIDFDSGLRDQSLSGQ